MGDGMVISLQVLRELVTVRYQDETPDQTFTAAELGFESRPERPKSESQRGGPEAGGEAQHALPLDGAVGDEPHRPGRRVVADVPIR